MTRNRQILIAGIVVGLALLAAGAYWLHPSREVKAINEALEQGQSFGVATGITTQRLQAQMAARAREEMRQHMQQGRADSPYLTMGPAMAEMMVERVAWERANPESLRGRLVTTEGKSVFREATASFSGVSEYVVVPNANGAPTLTLQLEGLQWKAARIDFPY